MKGKEVYTVFIKTNVLAILAARKWQTRRVIAGPGNDDHFGKLLGDWALSLPPAQYDGGPALWRWRGKKPPQVGDWYWEVQTDVDESATFPIRCRWQPGDILCVKEAYQIDGISGESVHGHYLADDVRFDVHLTDAEWQRWTARKYPYRATSARFMYRSLCRIKRPVIWSRAERVGDISLENAIAEGLIYVNPGYRYDPVGRVFSTPRLAFAAMWDSINPKALFESGVWVWAVEFERRNGE